MALTAAQLLDELMGKDRNLVPGEKSAQVPWDHGDVCKNFLCGFCPHDLFINTKADLGNCGKVHDDQLKQDYEKSSRWGKMGFEEEFVRYLSNIQADVDRKIRRGHERLLINQAREQELSEKDTDKTKMLTDHINQLLEEIETLGSEGKVEEAQGVVRLVDQLKEEKDQSKMNHSGVASQEKQMEVCEVCGAFLIVGDAQSRVDDHLQGKQHVGYAKIKSTLDDLKSRPWENRVKEPSEKKEKLSEVKTESTTTSRESRCDRSSERRASNRSRSKSRDRIRRDRSPRERKRSRDRRERDRRDRSRDRDRDRSRRESSRRSSRRSRSRSKDRSNRSSQRRSRSRDHRRSRHGSRDDKGRKSSRSERDRSSREREDKTSSQAKDTNGNDGIPAIIEETPVNDERTKSNEQSGKQDGEQMDGTPGDKNTRTQDDGQSGMQDDGQTDGITSQEEKQSAETLTGINSEPIGASTIATDELTKPTNDVESNRQHILNGSTNATEEEKVSSEDAIMDY